MESKPFPVVAILDADPNDRLIFEHAFEICRPDIHIHAFEDGQALLNYLHESANDSRQESTPDLIIVDLHVSEGNGLELIEEIKTNSHLKRKPLIIFIGPSPDHEIRRYYNLGVNTVMTRPVFFDELVEILKTLCIYWFGPMMM